MYCNYNLHLCTKAKLRARKNYRTLFHISGQNIVFFRNSSNLPRNILRVYCFLLFASYHPNPEAASPFFVVDMFGDPV